MTFIVTLIGLLIERFFDWSHLRRWAWFNALERSIHKKFSAKSPYMTIALAVIPLVLIVGLMDFALKGWWYGLIKFLFSLFVFLYCLGPQNLWADTFPSINALVQGDASFAADKLRASFGITDTNHPQSLHRHLLSTIFIEANRRVFAVLFWYVILGPVGAVLYRTIALSVTDNQTPELSLAAKKLEALLDWIPVRIFTFLFALGGHYVQVLSIWRKKFLLGLSSNEALLTDCGMAALNHGDETNIPEDGSIEREAISLLDRSFVISLALVAVTSIIWV